MSAPVLAFEGVSYAYAPERPVLHAVDLAIQPGDRVGLSGAIGAGKSTLIQLAVGLLRPAAGSVRLFGSVCREERDFQPARLRCGVLFQDPDDQLFCPTVAEDIAFGPMNQGLSSTMVHARVEGALHAVGLPDFGARVTYRLSGGEKRLVALAGVLAMHPELLLLDEPLVGLDPATASRIVAVLQELNLPMLIVSHQQAELTSVVNRRLHLEDGSIRTV